MALAFAQCLLFVAHKDSIPEALSPDSPPPPPVRRPYITVYALLPNNGIFYHISQIFTHFGITVLSDLELDQLLVEAIINDRVEVVEIFYDKKAIELRGRLVVYVDRFNNDILTAVFTGNRIRSSVSSEMLFHICCNDTDFDNLLDEENLRILERLTSIRADIRYRNEDGDTFLHFAIRRMQEALVRLLLEQGAGVNSRNLCGLTPLHVAAEFDVPASILDLLIQNGADINVAVEGSSWDGVTPLHIALRSCKLALVEYLLNNGGIVDVDNRRANVLQLAIESDDTLILACVLRHRPDINNVRNQAAFRSAIKAVKKDLVRMLAEFGFRLVPADAKDIGLLRGACASPQLIRDLLKWGAAPYTRHNTPNEKDSLERLLLEAMEDCHEDSIKLFLELEDAFSNGFRVSLLRKAVFLVRLTFAADILDSADLSLDFILNSFLSDRERLVQSLNDDYSGSMNDLREGPLRQRICEYISAVNALDLNVNSGFVSNAKYRGRREVPAWFLEAVRATSPEEFKPQVAVLKNERIGASTFSYHDFLNASLSQIVKFCRNRCVDEVLQADAYGDKFLSYLSMIKWRFRAANFRRILLDEGVKRFNFLFKQSALVALPYELKEKIVDYLCNLDLLVLVNVCELSLAAPDDLDHQ